MKTIAHELTNYEDGLHFYEATHRLGSISTENRAPSTHATADFIDRNVRFNFLNPHDQTETPIGRDYRAGVNRCGDQSSRILNLLPGMNDFRNYSRMDKSCRLVFAQVLRKVCSDRSSVFAIRTISETLSSRLKMECAMEIVVLFRLDDCTWGESRMASTGSRY